MKALLVGLSLIVAIGAVARDTFAFTCRSCDFIHGNPTPCRKLPSAHGLLVNTSAPAGSATDRANAINNAFAQWRKVIPDGQGITFAGNFTGSHNIGEPPSQVSFASPGSLFLPAGLGGIAYVTGVGCLITNIDIVLSNSLSYIPPPDTMPATAPGAGPDPGWHVVLHEFGHALGLALTTAGENNHPTTFSIMRQTGPFVSFGAFPFFESAANLAPDDAQGARFLYGSRPNTRNLTSTQTQLVPLAGGANVIDRLTPGPFGRVNVSRCRGQTINLPIHTANTGTFVETVNHRVYMQPFNAGNPWDAFHPSNITIAQQFGSVHNPNNTLIIPLQPRIPCNIPQGLYNVLHFADSTSAVAEYNELDNTSLYPDVFDVNCQSGTCFPP